jgi:hypothetical protein
MSRIAVTRGKGIRLKFDNGYELSIQWGPGNYCDNHSLDIIRDETKAGEIGSTTAEIAIFKGEIMLPFDDGDTVLGYVPLNEVLDWINKVRAWEPL